jgi:hypothetical protein
MAILKVNTSDPFATEGTTKRTTGRGSIADPVRPTDEPTYIIEEYKTFEEICGEVDFIVIASLVNEDWANDNYAKFTFNVKEALYGELSGEIDVYLRANENMMKRVVLDGENIDYVEDDLTLNSGNDELILFITLEENIGGIEGAEYTWCGAPIVNLSKLSYSQLYGQFIGNHMTGFDMSEATKESVLEYVNTLIASLNTSKPDLSKISFNYAFDNSKYVPETEQEFDEYFDDFVEYNKNEGYSAETVSFHIVYDNENNISEEELLELNAISLEWGKTEGLMYPDKMHISVTVNSENAEARKAIINLTANDKVEKIVFTAFPTPSLT